MSEVNDIVSIRNADVECPSEDVLIHYRREVSHSAVTPSLEQHIAQCDKCREALGILEIESDPLGVQLRKAAELEPEFANMQQRIVEIIDRARRDSVLEGNANAAAIAHNSFQPGNKLTVHMALELKEVFSEGGLGQVWKSTDEFGRCVAIKVIKPERARDPEVKRRFLREGRLTAHLAHPSIVTVYAAGSSTDDAPFFSMNLIDGVTLDAAIKMADKSLMQLLRSFIAVCHAVQFAHDEGIIHRDLKPSNILLGKHGETIVIDWGLAKFVADMGRSSRDTESAEDSALPVGMTSPGLKMGTPEYMSPEQATDKADVGRLSDVYSLGATLYAILVGEAPFTGRDSREICEKVQHGKFAFPSQLKKATPRPLEAVCLKAMALVPADRYQSVAELREDIERWLEDKPVTAHTEPFSAKASRWLKRHRTLTSVALATALVTLAALGVELNRARAANDRLEAVNAALQERVQQLAAAQRRLASELYQGGDMPRSLEAFSVELQLREQQYAAQPTDDRRFALVTAWNSVALTQHKSAKHHLATESYKVALEHLQQLQDAAPDEATYLAMRIRVLGNRGMTDRVLRGPEGAITTYLDALESIAQLDRAIGVTPERKSDTARLHANLADALWATEDTERELTHRQLAIRLMEELIADGNHKVLQPFLAVHAVRLTTTLLRLGRKKEALRELRDGITYCGRIELGEKGNSGQQLEAARCLVFLADNETDPYLSDAYRVRAIIVLDELHAQGAFSKDRNLAEAVVSENIFDSLRPRTDFRRLLKAIQTETASQP